jgi:glycosyltransferase involved in cell wall biosynthesis
MKNKIADFLEFMIKKNFLFFLNFFKLKIKLKYIFIRPKNNSNICLINTFDYSGGAAKVATLILEELINDFDIRLFVKTRKSKKNGVLEINHFKTTFLSEVLQREAKKSGWIEFTGFNAITLLENSFFQRSNIVHLHNLHGDFFSPAFFSIILRKKKVVWTLHDERILTGHCSCTLGCNKWKIGCGNCPDLNIYPSVFFDQTSQVLIESKKCINKLQPIIVCPSYWLADRVRDAYPDLKRIEVIHNGVNTTIFCPYDKLEAREKLGLPIEKKIVLFVAEFATKNPFKGGWILREIMACIDFKEIIFVTVGGNHETEFKNHICYPYVTNENELALLYSSADVLLYPTQADNLPLVVLESMSCGTPVIASNLGGIQEIINSDDLGVLVNNYNKSDEFCDKLYSFLNFDDITLSSMKINARLRIEEHFSIQKMISEYKQLYSINF